MTYNISICHCDVSYVYVINAPPEDAAYDVFNDIHCMTYINDSYGTLMMYYMTYGSLSSVLVLKDTICH